MASSGESSVASSRLRGTSENIKDLIEKTTRRDYVVGVQKRSPLLLCSDRACFYGSYSGGERDNQAGSDMNMRRSDGSSSEVSSGERRRKGVALVSIGNGM
ncbi:hypothetical protein HN51_011278 [Arachis hypogaea]